MARDYAKGKQSAGRRKAPARAQRSQRRAKDKIPPSSDNRGGRSFMVGVITGVFLSALVYLATLSPTVDPQRAQNTADETEKQPPKPRFDFYTLLPEQTFETDVEPVARRTTVVEPAADVRKPRAVTDAADVYVLQAGSFRQKDDADRRRAELLLLGLTPSVEEANGDNGRWYRVYLGPFETHSKMASARALTANQDIDTLVLKRPLP